MRIRVRRDAVVEWQASRRQAWHRQASDGGGGAAQAWRASGHGKRPWRLQDADERWCYRLVLQILYRTKPVDSSRTWVQTPGGVKVNCCPLWRLTVCLWHPRHAQALAASTTGAAACARLRGVTSLVTRERNGCTGQPKTSVASVWVVGQRRSVESGKGGAAGPRAGSLWVHLIRRASVALLQPNHKSPQRG